MTVPPPPARPLAKRPVAPAPTNSPTSATTKVGTTIGIRQPKAIVPRIVMYAGEKFGKTSFAAYAPSPVILMCRDTGYDTLLSAGTVPAVRAAEVDEWTELLSTVRGIADNPEGCKTLVIDGITGAEQACWEKVCGDDYAGKMGKDGFLSFQEGPKVAATEWMKLLSALDLVKNAGVAVVMLGHANTKSFKNPVGADYDRFEPACNQHTWGATTKWADCILFGKFHSIVDVGKREASKKLAEQKGKAIGGTDRVIFTQPHDAWVAGNRYGMESEIWLQGGPGDMWNQVMDQIRKPAAE